MTELNKRRLALGDQLRELRQTSGMSGRQLAELAGWPASKVSRIENAKQSVTDSDVRIWCQVTGAPEAVVAALRDQLRSVRLDEASRQRRVRGAQRRLTTHPGDIGQAATTIRVFELAMVPALVQTAEYARHLLVAAAELGHTWVDTDLAVQARMECQRVLYTPGKQIEIMLAESALRFPVCPRDVLGAQVDRLLALQGLPGVRLGMIPLGTQLPVLPLHGFWILDDVVLIKTMTSEIVLREARDLAVYQRAADALASVALVGTEARALLSRIADGLSTP
ncbi:MAG TPA: helix-turn-helix transcriptional regulator [Pseudonocardiaceae bacterium]|jgi:transcriptional regulator with XRE-family HTH domain